MFKVATNISKIPRDLKKFDRNRRFATAVGITWTAQAVRTHLRQTMASVFRRPTRWTLNSLFLKPAKRDDFDAKVFFKDFAPKGTTAGKYLEPQIEGGSRVLKRSEQHLRRGGFLDAGFYLVPGHDAKLNAYGNLTKGQMTKALSDVGAQFDPGQNTSRSTKKYFWLARAGRRLAGIYWRRGGKLQTFMVAVRRPAYRRRFDFWGEARKTTNAELSKNIDKAIARFKK